MKKVKYANVPAGIKDVSEQGEECGEKAENRPHRQPDLSKLFILLNKQTKNKNLRNYFSLELEVNFFQEIHF